MSERSAGIGDSTYYVPAAAIIQRIFSSNWLVSFNDVQELPPFILQYFLADVEAGCQTFVAFCTLLLMVRKCVECTKRSCALVTLKLVHAQSPARSPQCIELGIMWRKAKVYRERCKGLQMSNRLRRDGSWTQAG